MFHFQLLRPTFLLKLFFLPETKSEVTTPCSDSLMLMGKASQKFFVQFSQGLSETEND